MESPICGEQRARISSRATLPNSGFGSLTVRPWRHGHGEGGDEQPVNGYQNQRTKTKAARLMKRHQLLAPLASRPDGEVVERLLSGTAFRVERIVSTGQVTPPGQWYDQQTHEWILLLAGAATLRLDGTAEPLDLLPGDAIDLPAHCHHRVEWTDPEQETIWLAIHFEAGPLPRPLGDCESGR